MWYLAIACAFLFLVTPVPVTADGATGSVYDSGSVMGAWRDLCGLGNVGCQAAGSSRKAAAAFYIGYLDDRKGVCFGGVSERADSINAARIDFSDTNLRYPVKGVWLEGRGSAYLREDFRAAVSASYLIPDNRGATEVIRLAGVGLVQDRTFQTRTQWWTADFSLALCKNRPFLLIGGFRYDSFATYFKTDGAGTAGISTDEADIAVTGLVPYVGAEINQPSMGGGTLVLRVIGLPAYPSSILCHATYRGNERDTFSGAAYGGLFLEAVLDYSFKIGGGGAGLFAKWTKVSFSDLVNNTGEIPGTVFNNSMRTNFDRDTWVLGASFNATFGSPL